MNPSQRDTIIRQVAKINIAHGGCMPRMVEPVIRSMGFDDPGRELRRLKEAGLLKSYVEGIYWAKVTEKAQGLGKWL